MSRYEQGKKVRRVSAVIYLFIMAVIVGGTYISQLKNGSADQEKDDQVLVIPDKGLYVSPDEEILKK